MSSGEEPIETEPFQWQHRGGPNDRHVAPGGRGQPVTGASADNNGIGGDVVGAGAQEQTPASAAAPPARKESTSTGGTAATQHQEGTVRSNSPRSTRKMASGRSSAPAPAVSTSTRAAAPQPARHQQSAQKEAAGGHSSATVSTEAPPQDDVAGDLKNRAGTQDTAKAEAENPLHDLHGDDGAPSQPARHPVTGSSAAAQHGGIGATTQHGAAQQARRNSRRDSSTGGGGATANPSVRPNSPPHSTRSTQKRSGRSGGPVPEHPRNAPQPAPPRHHQSAQKGAGGGHSSATVTEAPPDDDVDSTVAQDTAKAEAETAKAKQKLIDEEEQHQGKATAVSTPPPGKIPPGDVAKIPTKQSKPPSEQREKPRAPEQGDLPKKVPSPSPHQHFSEGDSPSAVGQGPHDQHVGTTDPRPVAVTPHVAGVDQEVESAEKAAARTGQDDGGIAADDGGSDGGLANPKIGKQARGVQDRRNEGRGNGMISSAVPQGPRPRTTAEWSSSQTTSGQRGPIASTSMAEVGRLRAAGPPRTTVVRCPSFIVVVTVSLQY